MQTNNFETNHLKFIEFSLTEAFKDLFVEIRQCKEENIKLREETETIKAEIAELKKEKTVTTV